MTFTPGQAKCIQTLDAPLAVSAGAGSGKTFTLTRRIVHALESGAVDGIDRVLAITFTSKAAAELKSRIKGALRAEGMVGEALKVDSAWISTIHGACARILRSHALEVGVDPAFSVLGEAEAAPLLDAAVEEVLADADADGLASPAALDGLFAEYPARSHGPRGGGSVDDMVRTLVKAASANVRGMDAVVLPEAAAPRDLVRRMVEAAEGLAEVVEAQKPGKKRDALLDGTRAALEACTQAQAGGLLEAGAAGAGANLGIGRGSNAAAGTDPGAHADTNAGAGAESGSNLDVLALLDRFPVPGRGFGTPEFKDYAQDVAHQYGEIMAEARYGSAVAYLRDVRALAERVLAAYRRRKRQAGGLDNDDLLVETARAFERHPSLAAEYAGRFQLVMVDEFQDTDQLQVDMIKRMAGPACARLCTVGDAQQSIYRFRGADVSVYRRHVEAVRADNPEGVILLPDNFRSHADVLAFVDRIFGQPQVFGREFMSLSAARDESRVAHPFRGDGPRIDVQMVTRPSRGVSADEACRVAAQGIARRFSALHDVGHAAGEMVLLLGSTARADVYAGELRQAGFACVVVKGSLFNRAPEVQLMVRLAQALENPLDSLALFEVLSSQMFALCADDFLALSTTRDEQTGNLRRQDLFRGLVEVMERAGKAEASGGEVDAPDGAGVRAGDVDVADGAGACVSDADAPAPARSQILAASPHVTSDVLQDPAIVAPPSSQLLHAARTISKACRAVGRRRLSAVMEGVVRDSGWFARLEAQGAEGQAIAANVLKAIRMVEDIERGGAAGPASVAARFAEQVDIVREAPGALSAEGGDFVRIMTVHASKGLEFPLVAVAELGQGSARADKLLLEGVGGILYASLDRGNAASGAKSSSLLAKCTQEDFGCTELDEAELACRVEDCPSAAARRAALRTLAQEAEEQETRRLLYVALTRAKEALILSLSGKRTKDNPTGAKGIVADVQAALCGPEGVFPEGRAAFDFGGSHPAAFERVDLEAGDGASGEVGVGGASAGDAGIGVNDADGGVVVAGAGISENALPDSSVFGGDASGSASKPQESELFDLCEIEDSDARWDVPLPSPRADVFSYSSISSGTGIVAADDPRDDNAAAVASGREASESALSDKEAVVAEDAREMLDASDVSAVAAFSDDDAAAWAAIGESLSGEAAATDLGTAFHLLAQQAVESRMQGAALARPDATRVEAACRGCGLSSEQCTRLDAALERWFSSSVARRAASFVDVRAEVPFFRAMDDDGATCYLEGEIDLLATDGTGEGGALVVDYKTGGHSDEDEARVREKHRLQATCYAYAVLAQGYAEVECVFVRVEQQSAEDPAEPQCVSYRFAVEDLPDLEAAIVTARCAAQK